MSAYHNSAASVLTVTWTAEGSGKKWVGKAARAAWSALLPIDSPCPRWSGAFLPDFQNHLQTQTARKWRRKKQTKVSWHILFPFWGPKFSCDVRLSNPLPPPPVDSLQKLGRGWGEKQKGHKKEIMGCSPRSCHAGRCSPSDLNKPTKPASLDRNSR